MGEVGLLGSLQETWDRAAESGSVCTASLVEMFRYLCEMVETYGAILKAQPLYASLMEAVLAKVVLIHISALEKICMVSGQVLLPHSSFWAFRRANLCSDMVCMVEREGERQTERERERICPRTRATPM